MTERMEPTAELALGEVDSLEEVVDRNALTDLCKSTYELFGVSLRILSEDGTLLADVHAQQSICRYVNTFSRGAVACAETVGAVKRVAPEGETVIHPCFTGAVYRVVPIDYQGRVVGRFVIGPYLPAERTRIPRSLLKVDHEVDLAVAQNALAELPRVREETARRISEHLNSVAGLLIFSRHRALLTSEMHIASVRESYRELAEKNASLHKAFEELKELDKLKSSFLATVSHELRTPLTSILGYSEMMESGIGGTLSEEHMEFTQTIRSKGEHLLALITNLLDIGKLEQAQIRLNLEPVDPGELLREVETTIGPKAEKRGVKVETILGNDLPEVLADPVRLKQILFNLGDNAVKFSKETGLVRVSVRAAEMPDGEDEVFGAVLMAAPPRALCFSIADQGIGMPQSAIDKIFDAFYQVDGTSTREHEGAGLGLSIVKRLVDAHGGKIMVQSIPNQGTTFEVYIPEPEEPGIF